MWIEIKDKKEYNTYNKKGMRLHFCSGVNQTIKVAFKIFCKWLRKHYFFPVRVDVKIKRHSAFVSKDSKNKSGVAGGFYYTSDNVESDSPDIWIATGIFNKCKDEKKEHTIFDILFTVTHELTHYYQWFFGEFNKRTDRSLEIEATKWGHWLIYEFIDYIEDNKIKLFFDD